MKKIMIGAAVALLLTTSTPAMATSTDWVLPVSSVTPGSTNPAVTQANIQTTICTSGFTNTIRPPVSYTNKLKKQEIAVGGTYFFEVATYGAALGNYELDHLISLQLGGNPTDVKNLWMQPYLGNNARKKDVVETALKRLVCSNKITLVAAQQAISTNWVKAYNTYVTPADVKSASSNG
jgi:hypothetical protein